MSVPVETILGTIRVDQCDHFGHLNIQHYSGVTSDAFMVLMTLIGLGKDAVKQRQIGVVATDKGLRFKRELRAGDIYMVESAFVVAEPARFHIAHRMTRLTDGKLALTADTTCVPLDLSLRRKTLMPDDLTEAAQKLMAPASEFGL
jgi:acyl-CoA thioester hydrolase